MLNKTLTLATIAFIAAALVTTSIIATADAQQAVGKGKPTQKCNNVKVIITAKGIEAKNDTQSITASVSIGASSKTKTSEVDANDTQVSIPIQFKKVAECPSIGTEIFGNVNGTGFTSKLQSLKQPNKVTVDLSS